MISLSLAPHAKDDAGHQTREDLKCLIGGQDEPMSNRIRFAEASLKICKGV